jgi:LacI family transcriptional regulator
LGYILFRGDLQPLAKRLQDAGHRVVLIGTPRTRGEVGVPNVYGNHEQGGLLAARHLLELGHRSIAFYGDPEIASSPRLRGHVRAVNEWHKRGENIHSEVITYDQFARWRSHPDEARMYFTRPEAPTGIVSWNDSRAIEMLSLLNFIGLRVPQDISLVGYDNLPESSRIFPALTTVEANLEQQLETALGLLTQPEAPAVPPVVITLPVLIRRDSSSPTSR